MTDTEHPWLGGIQTEPDEVRRIYDGWAAEYDEDLTSWHYEVPQRAADRLRDLAPPPGPVLDAGCGTGLSGRALRAAGFEEVVGIDLSPESVALARSTGAYADVHVIDLQDLPTDFDDGAFAGLICVGVLTYLPDFGGTMAEFCRLVRPGGAIVVSQREDLWDERNGPAAVEALAADGRCELVEVTEPGDYFPDHETLGDLRVRLISLRIPAG